MKNIVNQFWAWYEKHYQFHLKFAAILFSWQVLHLIWLTAYITIPRLFSVDPPRIPGPVNFLIAIVDYTEIPALISVSLVYINELRKKYSHKNLYFLILLNSQWLHLFWITDEVVADMLINKALIALPLWLAWIAILIDYLELPVMYDTMKKFRRLKTS